MSTRARVGIVRNADVGHEIESIYVHWDGYPEHTGARLLEAWSSTERINQLMALGDLSSLGTEIGKAHDFDKHDSGSGACLAYGRDRGESDVSSITHVADEWPDYNQAYEYLWDSGSWFYRALYDPAAKDWAMLTREVVAA